MIYDDWYRGVARCICICGCETILTYEQTYTGGMCDDCGACDDD